MKRNRKLKLHEQPGLIFRARWLTEISTETLVDYLCTPVTKATRLLRAFAAAEIMYRCNVRLPGAPRHCVWGRDDTVYAHAWNLYFPGEPIPRGWTAPSAAFPELRRWAELDAQVH
ncbi:MAG TPA: hypothetical protein VFX20_15780 [Steroidobacteraceae bacterium]|nr:hypothetical protein [Steroidobacteraceae bacterium]